MLKARCIQDRASEFLVNGTASIEALSAIFASAVKRCETGESTDNATNKDIVDIISYYLVGDISITALLEVMKSAELASNQIAASVVTDALWMLGTLLSLDEKAALDETKSVQWTNLCNLTRCIHAEALISADMLKLSLEFNLLCGAGILKDETAIRSKLLKCNTQLIYRQQKYNLLREESEGYSKLFTLLCSAPPPPQVVEPHIRQLTSVIGYFDLDPNRVIDLVLDAFQQQLWNMSFVEVLHAFKRASIVHILGFKFMRYHCESPATSPEIEGTASPVRKDSTKGKLSAANAPVYAEPAEIVVPSPKAPHTLYSLAVVLISHDLVTLSELIPYLNPTAAGTAAECAAEIAKVASELKSFGVVSLSAKGNDTATPAASIAQPLPQLREFAGGNQLFGMLAAAYELKLLSVANEIREVILNGGCQLPSSFCQEVRVALIDLILWRTEPMYAPLSFSRLNLSRVAGRAEHSAILPNLPGQCLQVEDISDFMSEIAPMLCTLSHHLGTSPELFTRICRILQKLVVNYCDENATGTFCAMEVEGEDVHVRPPPAFIALLSKVMLPSLTRSKSVAAPCAQLLWSVLKPLPFQVRFALYEDWKGVGLGKDALRTSLNQEMKDVFVLFAEAKVLHYAKAQLKRLSKDNVKQMSRSLSNATHSCPLISYTHILNSIQAYDNLIPFVVDALKYTTDLSRDVMAFALIVQLQKDSEKLKPGDTHYSQWFASLSKFIATFYRKYPSTCIEGLLHFLVGSLSKGESLDLLVLRELLTKMGACETMLDPSQTQLEGLSGGKALQMETMGGLVKEGVPKKAVKALRDELAKTQTDFPLLYLISKIRSNIIFNLETTELKLVSHMYDVCQDVLMQFTEFLVLGGLNGCSNSEKNEKLDSFARTFPSLDELIQVGGLSVAVAFQLVRPLIRLALQSCVTEFSQMDPNNADSLRAAAACCNNVDNCPEHLQRWYPFSPSICGAIASACPEGGWPEGISMDFFSTYWSLSMYDLRLPMSRYQLEIRRLRERLGELDGSGKPSADDIDKTKSQRAAEIKKVSANLKSLHEEMDVQKIHVGIIAELLLLRKDTFFAELEEKSNQALYEHFVQHCVLPRLFLSPVDAIFGNQFFYFLQSFKTPKYSFQSFLEKFMKLMIPLIFSSTEYEASFLGHAINDVMILVNKWAIEPDVFAREMHHGSFQKFTAMFGMWNIRLKNVIKNAIESKEYMIIRSSMVLLSKVAMNFPSRRKVGVVVLEAVENLEKAETGRSDLSLMAKSLTTMLKRRLPTWIDDENKKPAVSAVLPTSSVPAVPPVVSEAPSAGSDTVNNSNEVSTNNHSRKSNSRGPSGAGNVDRENNVKDRDGGNDRDGRDNRSGERDGKSWKRDQIKDSGRPPKAETRVEPTASSKGDIKSSKEKDASRESIDKVARSDSKDRHPIGSSGGNGSRAADSGKEPGESNSSGKIDKLSSKPAKREREDNANASGGRSAPKVDKAPSDKDNRGTPKETPGGTGDGREDDKNSGSRKPMSSRLGSTAPGAPANTDLNRGGGGDVRGQYPKGRVGEKDDGDARRPAKRAKR